MIYKVSQFDPKWVTSVPVEKMPRGNRGTTAKRYYKKVVCAFDIETTRLEEIEQSIMYVWQFQIGTEITIIGREWSEFIELMKKISDALDDDTYICVYVHNLSYEFQFLSGVYRFKSDEVFAMRAHDILKCYMYNHIEFRCSAKLSGTSLDKLCEDMMVEHKKVGGFDYNKPRFPWTELTEEEVRYITHDVLGLVEAIEKKMALCGDTLYTIPMTVTGYVRRDVKSAMAKVPAYMLKDCLPGLAEYQLMREAIRGGNVHANRYFSGDVVRGVRSFDRSSSYPDVLVHCEFPVGKFVEEQNVDFDRLVELINVRKKAVIMRCAFRNVRLSDPLWPMPYIAKDKCRNIVGAQFDNGRILSADYFEMTITDIDFKIILSEYEFDDFEVLKLYHTKYGKLPKALTDIIISYYKDKTALKDVPGKELEYALAKCKVNSVFGMMAQDPIKVSFAYKENGFAKNVSSVEAQLESHNKKAFLCYQWGVWCTAWARYRLEESFWLTGNDTIYADTDSNKYIGDVDWTEFNNERIKDCMKSGAYAVDTYGKTHYMGVFEEETPEEGLYEFKTMGAKKYAYRVREDSALKITIAGVVKDDGARELDKNGGIQAFDNGFVFVEAGGNEIIYNDDPEVPAYYIDGHVVDITKNAVIRPSKYTVGITDDYFAIIEESKNFLWEIAKKEVDKAVGV